MDKLAILGDKTKIQTKMPKTFFCFSIFVQEFFRGWYTEEATLRARTLNDIFFWLSGKGQISMHGEKTDFFL